jgi:hypothetical protein
MQSEAWRVRPIRRSICRKSAGVGSRAAAAVLAASPPDRARYQHLHLPTGSQFPVSVPDRCGFCVGGTPGPRGGNFHHHNDGTFGPVVSRQRRAQSRRVLRFAFHLSQPAVDCARPGGGRPGSETARRASLAHSGCPASCHCGSSAGDRFDHKRSSLCPNPGVRDRDSESVSLMRGRQNP